MKSPTPEQAAQGFVDAINRGDVDAALQFYESDAMLVVQPGLMVSGHAALRDALSQMLALRPTLTCTASETLQAGDVALHHLSWTLTGTAPDGSPVQQQGRSADVSRRQSDGSWRLVIDNPFGADLIGAVAG